MPGMNLMSPARLGARAAECRRKRWARLIGVATVSGLGVIAGGGVLMPDADAQRMRVAELERELDGFVAVGLEQQARLEAQEAMVDRVVRIGRQPRWADLLRLLGVWCEDSVRLESVTLRVEPNKGRFRIAVAGLSESQDAASAFVERVSGSAVFEDVLLGGSRRLESEDRLAVRFEFTAQLIGYAEHGEVVR